MNELTTEIIAALAQKQDLDDLIIRGRDSLFSRLLYHI